MDYRVIAYDPRDGWNLRAVRYSLVAAKVEAEEARGEFQLVAVVRLDGPRLSVIEANVAHPQRLLNVAQFRNVATAL